MSRKIEVFFLSILLTLVISPSLSASTDMVSILLTVMNPTQGSVRYQLNSESVKGWEYLPENNYVIRFETDDKTKDTVYLQQQNSNGQWSESTRLVWDVPRASWVMVKNQTTEDKTESQGLPISRIQRESEQGTTDYDVLSDGDDGSHESVERFLSLGGGATTLIPLLDVKDTYYTYGYGASLAFAWNSAKHALSSDIFYQAGLPENIAVEIIHEGGAALYYGYKIGLGAITLQPEVGGGLILHAAYRRSKLLGFYHDGFVLSGLKMVFGVTDNIDVYLRGQVHSYKWNESDVMHTAVVSAGISTKL